MDWGVLAKVLANTLIPIINPKLAPLAPIIGAAIDETETLGGSGSGAAKLQTVTDLVNNVSTGINTATGKQIVDVPNLGAAVQAAVSAVVSATNAVHPTVKNT